MLHIIESDYLRLGLALIGSIFISMLTYKIKALSISGALSAFVMGVSFVFFGEPIWFLVLLTFFASSTFWSKYKKHSKRKQFAEQNYEKSSQRDAWQVFANGGLGMILCIAAYFYETEWILPIYIMIMAVVNADTWATEIGSLSKSKPRHIITWKPVTTGTSGGITLVGSLAALAGAALIGLVATALSGGEWQYSILAIVAGFAGCMIDSLLGATVQRMFQCTTCQSLTEKTSHCGHQTEHKRGWIWINNDIVNVSASVLGSLLVWICYIAMF